MRLRLPVPDACERTELDLAPRFRKSEVEEAFLRRFNETLAPQHDADLLDLGEQYSTVHVIGPPRSGTTLLVQLISSCLEVGYVNNLIACFWDAPVYGIHLSRKLLGTSTPSSFDSEFGRTQGPAEPHEFGLFWSRLLGYRDFVEPPPAHDEEIDWQRVRRVLTNMCAAFAMPVVFKSFHLIFHLERIAAALPMTCFVRVRRDPVQTAMSLLRARRQYASSEDDWVGVAPKEYEWLRREPVPVQVAGQVHFLDRLIDGALAAIGGANVLELRLDDVTADPALAVTRVAGLLEVAGNGVPARMPAPGPFPAADRDVAGDPQYAEVSAALRSFH